MRYLTSFITKAVEVVKMSDTFLSRHSQASEKLSILKAHLDSEQKLRVQEAITLKKKQLLKENAELKAKIERYKEQLCNAEIMNGKTQVALPKRSAKCEAAENLTVTDKQEPKKEVEKKTKPEKSKQPKGAAKKKEPVNDEPVDVSRLDMRIGCIVSAEKHPDADSLYVEDVDTGEDTHRTVVSGLVKHIPLEQMQNRMVILLMNLKPAKMRGVVSQAMVMCASSPEKVEILDPPPGSAPGDRITFAGYSGEPDKQLNPKKKVWERIQPDLHTDGENVACYKGVPFTVEGRGVCKAQTMAKSSIK